MAAHHLDHLVSSDLSYHVLQRQRRDPEVTAAKVNQAREVEQPITVNRFLRHLDEARPELDGGDGARYWGQK